jgi:uncharacterized protein (DUF697 family)
MAEEKKSAAAAQETVETPEVVAEISPLERLGNAGSVVNKSMLCSAALGIVPISLINWVGLTAIQVVMLKKLGNMYGVPFRQDVVKKLVGVLVAGATPTLPSAALAMALGRIPVIGAPLRFCTLPVVSAAFTYALGKVFVQHFESGGTFLSFDPTAVKAYFAAEFKKGTQAAAAAVK